MLYLGISLCLKQRVWKWVGLLCSQLECCAQDSHIRKHAPNDIIQGQEQKKRTVRNIFWVWSRYPKAVIVKRMAAPYHTVHVNIGINFGISVLRQHQWYINNTSPDMSASKSRPSLPLPTLTALSPLYVFVFIFNICRFFRLGSGLNYSSF